MNKCIICGKDSGKGKTCSSKCRQTFYRYRNVTDGSVTDVTVHPENVTVNPISVTKSPQSVTTVTEIESVTRVLTPAMLAGLPHGVSRPTAQPTPETAGVHAAALMDGMNRYSAIDWLGSPEYAETAYRLLTSSVEQLEAEGQFVPCWKGAA